MEACTRAAPGCRLPCAVGSPGNIVPGASGSVLVDLTNTGTMDGDVYIWAGNITGDVALGQYLYFNFSQERLESTVSLPATVYEIPDSPFNSSSIVISPLQAGETLTLNRTFEFLETGTPQNEAQGKSLAFTIYYTLFNTGVNGSISGYKRNASTGLGIPDWPIYLANRSGVRIRSLTTDANGYFNFTDLYWGTYNLSEGQLPDYAPEGPPFRAGLRIGSRNLDLGPINFTNRLGGNISGLKFNDLNGNGVQDVNEKPLPGFTMTLRDSNGTLYGTMTTDGNGTFAIDEVHWGNYTLREVHRENWVLTAPQSGFYNLTINGTHLKVSGLLFGNRQQVGCCDCPTSALFSATVVQSPKRTVRFTDQSTGNPVQWLWKFGDGKTSQLKDPVHTYARKGRYTVKEYVKGMNCKGKTYWVTYKKRIRVR
jgi:hypothetical protein